MHWFENCRMEWIKETLRVFGYINREHLVKKFYISIPQASKDLNAFLRANPTLLQYNTRTKRYEKKQVRDATGVRH